MMKNIRKATLADLERIAEILVTNYRLNFYPIFKNDDYYFNELQVSKLMKQVQNLISTMWVYDDGSIKGFIQIDNQEIKKLYVEPILQSNGIGSSLVNFAVYQYNASYLWALEMNARAICFYQRHGFHVTNDKKLEEGTDKPLIRLER